MTQLIPTLTEGRAFWQRRHHRFFGLFTVMLILWVSSARTGESWKWENWSPWAGEAPYLGNCDVSFTLSCLIGSAGTFTLIFDPLREDRSRNPICSVLGVRLSLLSFCKNTTYVCSGRKGLPSSKNVHVWKKLQFHFRKYKWTPSPYVFI